MDRNQILTTIASSLSDYEPGDILLLSDIIDEINKLYDCFPNSPEANKILDTLCTKLQMEISGKRDENLCSFLSKQLDLLNNFVPQTEAAERKNSEESRISEQEEEKNEDYRRVLEIFVVEAEERLTRAQELILELENNTDTKEKVNEIFRCFHTIKGECGFLKLATFGELAHNIENLLDMIRNEELEIDSDLIDVLLNGIDQSREALGHVKTGNFIYVHADDFEPYINSITKIINQKKPTLGTILVEEGKISDTEVSKILNKQKNSLFSKKFGEVAAEENYVTDKDVKDALKTQKAIREIKTTEMEYDPIIKVKASRINFLVDMIGELIIAEGMINEEFCDLSQIKKITRELQHAAMSLKAEKVKILFHNMNRLVRDVRKKLNKEINFITKGENLEIDRDLIENLEEPLIHILRNAIDHGIENKELRQSRGKPLEGTVILNAERRGNHIVISIRDDGGGLDKEKIKTKAIEKKIVTEEQLKTMTDNEIYNLIFVQGFSTSEKIDLVSGRGVGMDIVKAAVGKSKGRIEIKTEQGKYTEFLLVFPLSMAIIDGMIVKIAGDTYIIPVANIIESVKAENSMFTQIKEKVEILHLREEVIPVINVKYVLELEKTHCGRANIAVIVENDEGKKYALLVDELVAKKEIVIKSLGNKFKKLKGVSSGTILAGGEIGLILDIAQLIEKSREDKE